MTAVILAAGIASRLRPLTDHLPKSLLTVGNRPLLQRTLEALKVREIHRVVIVVGYRHEQIRDFVSSIELPYPVVFVQNDSYAKTNNNYSLWLAAPECAGQDILILDADILFHSGIIAHVLRSPRKNVIAYRPDRQLSPEEVKIVIDGRQRISAIGKDIMPASAAGESIGIERFGIGTATALFRSLRNRKNRDEYYEASFQELIDRGTVVYAVNCESYPSMEIDTADDLREAEALAMQLPS
jgi:choline kinase